MVRRLAAILMLLVTSSQLLAAEAKPGLQAEDVIHIILEEEAAELYLRCCGGKETPISPHNRRQVQTFAKVRRVDKEGTVEIEHTLESQSPARMVVLRGIVNLASIQAHVTPKGTAVSSSPGSDPVLTKEETTSYRVAIKELKGFKLRAWTLEEEFGDETAEAEAIVPFRYRANGPWRNSGGS